MQPAHVAEKGHVQAEAGMDINTPTGSIVDVVDAASNLTNAARNRALTADEQRKVFDAGVNVAVNPPAIVPHAGIAYVPVDRLEVGLRYVAGGWRLGARYQVLKRDQNGVDLSLGFGVTRFTYEFPVSDQIPFLELEDFSRWQFDIPLLIGKAGSWYRWWAGPKLMFTTYKTSLNLKLPNNPIEVASFKGTSAYYGAQAGVAFGYKHVFVGLELTLAEMLGHADSTLLDASHRTNTNSFIVYPAIGLLAEF